MAEIEIERKKKPVWPWILLLVLLALVGWAIYEYMQDRNMTTLVVPAANSMVVQASAQPLQPYAAV